MMDWDTEVKLFKVEHMITVYEKHIEDLEKENKSLRLQVEFLKQQLSYKTFGKPTNEEVSE
ncbi:MAG: hypothetical protein CM15mV20_2420 [uncultured marine virus]|nr:MAG: hypothetical protein CM15mV20_2420 [uncultured marine virus]